MRFLISPFMLILTAVMALVYWYISTKFPGPLALLLLLPFIGIWILPALYWSEMRRDGGRKARLIHIISYISMGWLSSLISLLLLLDLITLTLSFASESLTASIRFWGPLAALLAATMITVCGALFMRTGPSVKEVAISIDGLAPELDDLRIVQISDLHVGPVIRKSYVEKVLTIANSLKGDIVALTGDFVDGSVDDLAEHIEPLKNLEPQGRCFFVMGNHDYYSGASAWIREFQSLGFDVLLNSHRVLEIKGRRILVAGVTDPAVRMMGTADLPNPEKASSSEKCDLRLLLAHNPTIANRAEQVGYDLQLSGHTHGGQFWPWTWVVRRVHNPHYLGLSREGRMQVYVNAGTGSWGPPLRFGTTPEITLLRLISAQKV